MELLDLLYYIYLVIFALVLIIGLCKYKYFDGYGKIIFAILFVAFINELVILVLNFYQFNTKFLYHIYCAIDFILMLLFFLKTINTNNRTAFYVISIIIVCLAVLNCIFFQPITSLNSNMLILESFFVIIMSLYSLYRILLNDKITFITRYPIFWFWVLFLTLYAGTFFFWAIIKTVGRNNNDYFLPMEYTQEIINIVVYAGFGFAFF